MLKSLALMVRRLAAGDAAPRSASALHRFMGRQSTTPTLIPPTASESPALGALRAAALALPGLMAQSPEALAAPGDIVDLQYGSYKQTPWQLLGGLKSQYNPLQVDNIEANGVLTFSDRWKFGFNYAQDTWSGATPVSSAPYAFGGNNPSAAGASPLVRGNGTILYDKKLTPFRLDPNTANYVPDNRLVQTIASASPEIRNQGNFRLGYEWDEAAVNLGGGVSQEPDYNSAFGSLNGRMDFNQKLTSVNLGLNYANSDINALINPLYSPYVDQSYYAEKGQINSIPNASGAPGRYLTGNRQDWTSHLSVAQVINKDLLLESGIGFTRSTGYLGNPYKAVDMVFVDTQGTPVPPVDGSTLPPLYAPQVQAVVERRPEERNQGMWDMRFVEFVEPLDASVHGGYRFFIDDWGITAHTFDIDWVQPVESWTVTPRFRYYSQNGADFYQPYFLFQGKAPKGPDGRFNLAGVPLDAYSSDYRLSAYGALSGGITVARPIGKAMAFEAGFEYYAHAGDLRLGGAGQGSWSNFDYYQFNAAVKVDLSAISTAKLSEPEDHAGHHHHSGDHRQQHLGMDAPSGVLFNHMLADEGDTMVGVRYAYALQQGGMRHGTGSATDQQIVAEGCGPSLKCTFTPKEMDMGMVMVDLMYAPTDWLTLMLMPQFMSMDMHLRRLDGSPDPGGGGHAAHGANPYHATGGVGDIFMGSLFKLYEAEGHKLHFTLGFTAPTGSVNQRVDGNTEFEHYGMQLGTGTWNIWPSLTYNGYAGDFNWGGQVSTNAPLQNHNDSGFAFGTLFQTTAWGGIQIQDWLSGSVRALYTFQDSISGNYPEPFVPSGPMDTPQSYGGQYLDIGIGLNASVPSGDFEGNHFGIEWLQPAYNDYNGYQLERTGTLWASWALSF